MISCYSITKQEKGASIDYITNSGWREGEVIKIGWFFNVGGLWIPVVSGTLFNGKFSPEVIPFKDAFILC